MKLLKITSYSPYEKMNMLRTGAGYYRYGYLVQALNLGFTHIEVQGQKLKTIHNMIKSCSRWRCLGWHDNNLAKFPFRNLLEAKIRKAKKLNIEYLPI